jgi:nitroimidazol reductase NimA-like FMN-containing flavoprotein (pyridoxamine 5'-phosphate oxidase superfamily)
MEQQERRRGGATPTASRPFIPGYGILDANSGRGLFPWSWATERLTAATTYWIATVRPDGRPHAMPVWGVWLDDGFYFSSGTQSRKVRNLTENPRCVVACEVGEDQIILEGIAEQASDPELRRRFCDEYQTKYDWDMEGFSEPFFVVHPTVVFGFTTGSGSFGESATRWVLDEE